MKIIARIFLIILILLAVVGVSIYAYLWSISPQYSGELILKGLKQKVEVLFDEYGVPHIYAQTEEDAYFALGYVHAQERLFQMEMIRRVGEGRLAEILGEKFIENDQFFRTIGIREHARASAQKFMSERKEPFQKAAWAYIDGINQYLETGATPIEFTLMGIPKQKFTPENLYSITGFMAFGFADAFRTDPLMSKIQRKFGNSYLQDLALITPANTEKIPVFSAKPDTNQTAIVEEKIASTVQKIMDNLPVPAWLGSNSWVIAPSKTESGKVIFTNDAHIGYSQPCVWYEAHLEAPNFSFYGNHLAGVPFGTIGHTRTHAWGMTMFENDDLDFFREKINPNNPNQVWYKGKWVAIKTRDEEISVKGKNPIKFQVKITPHGPLINEVVKGTKGETAPISMWWMFTQEDNRFLETAYDLPHAKNIDEVRKAVALIHAPGLNVMYGDKAGNIAWWAAAKLVKYPLHVNPKLILDGASGKDEPIGFYDFSENPQSENPPTGYVYSANNQPDSISGQLYPGYYLPENRAQRIVNLLNEKNKKWNIENSQAMITDVVSDNYPEIVKSLLPILEEGLRQKNTSSSPEQTKPEWTKMSKWSEQAIEILKKWQGNHQLKDIAPTIFYKLIYTILKNTFRDELGENDFRVLMDAQILKTTYPVLFQNPQSPWWDDKSTRNQVESQKGIVYQSFEETLRDLSQQLGENSQEWHWEKVHILKHEHAIGRASGFLGRFFNVGPFGIYGGSEVINNLNFKPTEKGIYKLNSGPSKRIVIDFADIENAYSILPTGQSGNLMSRHYSDQAQMYNEGKFRKMLMNRKEIEGKSRKLILKP
jgi:penicillin G amidase